MRRWSQYLSSEGVFLALAASLTPIAIYLFPSSLARYIHSGWTTPGLLASADLSSDILVHIVVTVGRSELILLLGLIFTAQLVFISMVVRSRLFTEALTLLSAVPPLVWVPLSLAYFGLNQAAFDVPASLFVSAMLAPSATSYLSCPPKSADAAMRLIGLTPGEIWWKLNFPWLVDRLTSQLNLIVALTFGMCTVVEYMSGTYGVGAVLKLLTGAAEFRQIIMVTMI